MNHASGHDDKLEHLIGDTLRELPARRAPDALQLRVLDEIEHRFTTPWWHRNFARWPLTAQAVFLVVSVTMAKIAIDLTAWLMDSLDATRVVTGMTSVAMSMKLLAGVGASLVDAIPSLWIYGGIAAVAAMYVALFGISAAAYRTLYADR